jgi:hypothetical protein
MLHSKPHLTFSPYDCSITCRPAASILLRSSAVGRLTTSGLM